MRWLTATAALLVVLALAALACLGWLIGTEPGLRWALARAESAAGGSLQVEAASGALAGTVLIERLRVDTGTLALEVRGLRLKADLLAALAARIAIDPLEAASVELALRPGEGGEPATAPPSLPFSLHLGRVSIGHLAITREGERHVLTELELAHLRLDRAVSAQGSVRRPDERFPAQASFAVKGTLERLEIETELSVAGIPARLRAQLQPFAEPQLAALEARAGPVDVSRFDAALPRTALSVEMRAKGVGAGLAGTLEAANAAHGPIDTQRVPVERVEARFASPDLAAASLERLRIVLSGGGTLEGSGEASAAGFKGELRASGVDLRALRSTLRRTSLEGPLTLDLGLERQRVAGKLTQNGMRVAAELERAGDRVEIRNLRAEAAGGELKGSGRLELGERLAFEARLALSRFDPSAFGDYPGGSLDATVETEGRLGGELEIDASWRVQESTLLGRRLESRGRARVFAGRVTRAQAEARFGTARASVRGALGRTGDQLAWQLHVPKLEDFAPDLAGRLDAKGTLSGSWRDPRAAGTVRAQNLRLPGGMQANEASARFEGHVSQHELRLAATAPDIALNAHLRGGWDAARGWSGEILSLENAGDYPLKLAAPAPLKAAPGGVTLGRLETQLGKGRLLISNFSWEPGRLVSSGEFSALPVQWLLTLAGQAERASATLLLDGAWSVSAAPALEGTLQVQRASGDVTIAGPEPVPLELEEVTLEGRLAGGRLEARAKLVSRLAAAQIEGEVAQDSGAPGLGFGAGSPLSLRAAIDFAALRMLAQPVLEDARLDGKLRAEVRAGGTLGEPAITGELVGSGIRFEMPAYGVDLKDGTLRAMIEGQALRIAELSIQGGTGSFSASGTLPLRFADAAAKLEWQARDFTLLDRPDMRLIASGKGEAQFDGKRVSLVGDLRADRGFLQLERERLPQLGEDVVIAGRPRPAREEKVTLPLSLDVMLDLGDDLRLRAHGFEGKLAGRVQVQTNAQGELRAYGRLHAVNATFEAYGQRLQVDPGAIIFDGPIDNPALQITAWRRNQAVEAGVQISGTASAPRVQLVSQPPVPEGERLSWLVLGRAPGQASAADLGLLQAAAGALLSRGDSVPLDRRIARSVGLDELTVRGSGAVEGNVLAFGKRLSDRLYVSYEQGLGAVVSNLVKLDYALSQRWSLRAETGTTSGAGIFYRFSWD